MAQPGPSRLRTALGLGVTLVAVALAACAPPAPRDIATPAPLYVVDGRDGRDGPICSGSSAVRA
jgi:hypothetical protein